MDADYIEQDVIASRDGVLLVLHDVYLESVTDVAARFPNRGRADGHFYAVDFDYEEIAQLNVHERTVADENDSTVQRQLFADRFPATRGRFGVATLQDELDLIAGLNASTGRRVGIYPEIKDPAWHLEHGIDLTHLVVTALEDAGFFDEPREGDPPPVYLQCFDAEELRRIRRDVDPPIPLVQLLTGDAPMTAASFERIADYAQGIGPPYLALVDRDAEPPAENGLCRLAQSSGLLVHPYTFRSDLLPPFSSSFAELIEFFALQAGIDGLFTDFPDRAVAVIDELNLH